MEKPPIDLYPVAREFGISYEMRINEDSFENIINRMISKFGAIINAARPDLVTFENVSELAFKRIFLEQQLIGPMLQVEEAFDNHIRLRNAQQNG